MRRLAEREPIVKRVMMNEAPSMVRYWLMRLKRDILGLICGGDVLIGVGLFGFVWFGSLGVESVR